MPVTPHELEQFHDYVQARLEQSRPPESLQECLNQWCRDQAETEIVDDLQQAMTEIDAGAGIDLNDATTQLRAELSWYGPRSWASGS